MIDAEMSVRIDETWETGVTVEVQHLGIFRDFADISYRFNSTVADHDQPAAASFIGDTVDQIAAAHSQDLVLWFRLLPTG